MYCKWPERKGAGPPEWGLRGGRWTTTSDKPAYASSEAPGNHFDGWTSKSPELFTGWDQFDLGDGQSDRVVQGVAPEGLDDQAEWVAR